MKGLLLKMLNAVHSFRLALVLKQLHRHIKLKLKRTLKKYLKKIRKVMPIFTSYKIYLHQES